MIGRANAMRGLVALACLAGASCTDRTPAVRAVTAPEHVPAVAAVDAPDAEDGAAADAGTPLADPVTEPVPAAAAASTDESAAAPDGESPLVAPAPESEAAPQSEAVRVAASVPPPADTLDFASLVARLRKTKALNLLTKVAVKNQSNDLLEEFRAYHTQHGTATLAELRRAYDSLFYRLHSLLQDADPPLARDIDRSRAAIWEILSDSRKFTASHLMAGA